VGLHGCAAGAQLPLFRPQSVTLDGSNTASATVTLMTVTRGLATADAYGPCREVRTVASMGDVTQRSSPGWPFCLMLYGLMSPSRGRSGLAAAAGLLAVSVWTYSCGGYGNGKPALLGRRHFHQSDSIQPVSLAGSSSTGTVTLSGPASSYGATVNLSSSATAAIVPASVTVASGGQQRDFYSEHQ